MQVCVFLGPPGAGKGTQAQLLAESGKFRHLSTGEVLRSQVRKGTEAGLAAKHVMDNGLLVGDELLFKCISSEIEEAKASKPNWLILDGVPRAVSQVALLDQFLSELKLSIGVVIEFSADPVSLVERFSNRLTCRSCGFVSSGDPSREHDCPKCGTTASLVRRKDDAPEAVKRRLEIYEEVTRPVRECYVRRGNLFLINALRSVESVQEDILKNLENFSIKA